LRKHKTLASYQLIIILLLMTGINYAYSQTNLVSNPGFESGTTNWTIGGGGIRGITTTGSAYGATPYSGVGFAYMGSSGTIGTISQTVSVVSGSTYTVSFYLTNFGGTPNSFVANFSGINVLSLLNQSAASPYARYSGNVLATSNSALLEFLARQDPQLWGLDDISITLTSGASPSSNYRSNTLSYLRNHAAGAAGMLDSLYNNAAMSGVMTALDGLTGAAQANAISQTLPVITGASSQATTSSMQALNQIVQGRSNSLRGMASGDEYIGNRDMWMKGFGSWANQNDVNGVAGYKVNTGGLAIGVDQGFTPKLNIGAVLALSNSGVSSNSSSAPSGVTINSYQAGVYGDYAIDPKIIANAQADIGLNQNKEYRNITFMGTNANGTYNSYSGHLGTGVKYLMPIDMENTFIPSVRVDYTTVQSQAYSESGAGALNLSVAKQTYNTLIPSADVRIDHSLDSKMTLSANAGAGYNTLNNQVSATSAYAGGGTTFATNGLQVSPWLYNAGVGVTGQIDKNLQLNIRYDNVFSPTGYMNQMVSAKLKIPL